MFKDPLYLANGRIYVVPSADANCIDARVFDDLLPIVGYLGDIKFIRYPLTQGRSAVDHGHDFDAILRLQAGNVQLRGIAAGTDYAGLDIFIAHESLSFLEKY